MPTNEELAVMIQEGGTEYLPQLWVQVRRYVELRAGYYAIGYGGAAADAEDFTQSGYFALLAAVKRYSPERGAGFLTCLTWELRKEFATVAGVRTSKRDGIQFAQSLDAPFNDEPDSGTLHELVGDCRAVEPFSTLEDSSYTQNARKTLLHHAKRLVGDRKTELLFLIYFEGYTLEGAAEALGYGSKQGADQDHKWALRRLYRSSAKKPLRELLEGFGEVDAHSEGMQGVGVGTWKRTGESATERVAIRLIERGSA